MYLRPPQAGTELSPLAPRIWVLPSGHTPCNHHDQQAKPGEGLQCCRCLQTRYVCALPSAHLPLPASLPFPHSTFPSPLLSPLLPLSSAPSSLLSFLLPNSSSLLPFTLPSSPLPLPTPCPPTPRSKTSYGEGDMQSPCVTNNGAVSETFTLTNEVKQGCALAPTILFLMFSAYRDERPWIRIAYQMDDRILERGGHESTAPHTTYNAARINFNGDQLKSVATFTYLSSNLSAAPKVNITISLLLLVRLSLISMISMNDDETGSNSYTETTPCPIFQFLVNPGQDDAVGNKFGGCSTPRVGTVVQRRRLAVVGWRHKWAVGGGEDVTENGVVASSQWEVLELESGKLLVAGRTSTALFSSHPREVNRRSGLEISDGKNVSHYIP
ncbi:unnamed protein product [Schistocephalus solidus]|uniref:Uncharacterized protein n=1 Tax=Schistocephalus solidus TaxID=70667 RepID=A0A183STN8_SCHSO|nr:unnamed protein product [Schistocephalus solidus]